MFLKRTITLGMLVIASGIVALHLLIIASVCRPHLFLQQKATMILVISSAGTHGNLVMVKRLIMNVIV